jgi:predicted PurR-regulated permease PerM
VPFELTDRQRRLIDAILVIATIAIAFVVLGYVADLFYAFGDILLVFFLAWLLSFILLPVISGLQRLIPRLPQAAAVIAVYVAVVALFLGLIVQVSSSIAASTAQFIQDAPELEVQLEQFLRELEGRLATLGFTVDLVGQAPLIVQNLQSFASQLVGPVQAIALASVGVLGSLLIIVILSVYIAVDRTAILAFLYRLVPPGYATEARLLQVSVSRSFGGFLRGQSIMGLTYGALAAIVNIAFGLEYGAATAAIAGALHAIPFFGPFVSWLPPVAVALLLHPEIVLPVLAVMGVGWFLTMNVLQPRLMAGAVGIHPVVVLGSVLVGARIAGIPGAIFGIPMAAVLSAFFFHWYGRSRETGTVADRAAARIATREGRRVRRPREPIPGVDEDVADVRASPALMARPMKPAKGRRGAPGVAGGDPERQGPEAAAPGLPAADPALGGGGPPLAAGEAER